jgi:hypothetical protein
MLRWRKEERREKRSGLYAYSRFRYKNRKTL